ncbi:MAG: crosslink repair DNA glycosylase YcaQ family protein [Caldilineaceae bacterium]
MIRQITAITARRLAITAQGLAGPQVKPTQASMLALLRQIRCLQLDPIRAVERTQYLVLWSRLGNYKRDHLHDLVYGQRQLFEYWAHCASLVLTEDYPIHEHMMRNYGKSGSASSQRLTKWVAENDEFRQYVLDELRVRGPLRTGDFEDTTKVAWASGGWNSGRTVSYMLDYLWSSGQILVARRNGLDRWWDLAERVHPEWLPAADWDADQVTYDAAQKSLRALGIGRERDIGRHFIERRYRNLGKVLNKHHSEELIVPVEVTGWPDQWYIHRDLVPMLNAIEAGEWQPRTTLLSPFDNLIRDRDRTELMWDFFYRIEIYVPAAKRQYGYYVLPILHGDTLIGRVSPRMDWKNHRLTIEAIYLESTAKPYLKTGRSVLRAIKELARFLGTKQIDYGDVMPDAWRRLL